jgi:hypothetical protein
LFKKRQKKRLEMPKNAKKTPKNAKKRLKYLLMQRPII